MEPVNILDSLNKQIPKDGPGILIFLEIPTRESQAECVPGKLPYKPRAADSGGTWLYFFINPKLFAPICCCKAVPKFRFLPMYVCGVSVRVDVLECVGVHTCAMQMCVGV